MEVARELQWTWERAGWTFILPDFPTWEYSFEYTIPGDHPDAIFNDAHT